MAIPSMFHSSCNILETTAMAYLAEGTSSSGKEGGLDPLSHTATTTLTQETGNGEQRLEFSPSSVNCGLFQSEHMSRSSESLRDGREKQKNGLAQQSGRERTEKNLLMLEGKTQKRESPAFFEQEDNPPTFTNSRSKRTVKVCSRPECESQEQHTAFDSDFTHQSHYLNSQAARLCLHRFEVGNCLDIYSSNGGSCSAELNSDPESPYLYAESIKGCGSTSCSTLQECNSTDHCADGSQETFNVLKQWEDGCNKTGEREMDGACKIMRRSGSYGGHTKALCMYTDTLSFDLPDYSTEAVMGSDNSCRPFVCEHDSDNTLFCEDWEQSFDSSGAEASVDSLDSLTEAQWGSVSSRISSGSGHNMDCGVEISYCFVEQSSSSDFAAHVNEGHCNPPVSQVDEDDYDLYNAWTENSDMHMAQYGGQEKDGGTDSLCSKGYSLNENQGAVTQTDRCHFAGFFHEMVKRAVQERDQAKLKISEGFLFHPQKFLQEKNSRYREGLEYSLLRNIQNGSYGDVFSVRDKQTGYTCAAKRIPLSSFSWEEVRTWSRLDSPHVLQLFGAVREGLNIILFMDLKTGSLAQLLKIQSRFSEDLALYYHSQVLQALEHLHSRQVIHLDVKVDNVLLSKDGRECFLCDFGLSEMLDQTGCSTKTFRGNGLRGTESHMSPEVARGDPRSDKADVWSSCCMLLHMLSGHQPWMRYYTRPLCLKIVSEPAPLWEIPPGCNPPTCEIIRGGLVKEPRERDSARELLEKTRKALRAVGRVSDPVLHHLSHTSELQKCPRRNLQETPALVTVTTQETLPPVSVTAASSATCQEMVSAPRIQWVSTWRERAAGEDETDSEESESDEESRWGTEEKTYKKKRVQRRVCMERHWEKGDDLVIKRQRQPTLSEDKEECQRERENVYRSFYTDLNEVWDKEDQHKERAGWLDSEETDGTDGTMDGVLGEMDLYEGKTQNLLDEDERENGEDSSEQVESDLESLRELGSDWTEEEWEPFHRLQILYSTKAQPNPYIQSKDYMEEESLASITLSEQKMTLSEQSSKLPFICHHSSCDEPDEPEPELTDKLQNSDSSDYLSSGVFSSYSSLTDGQSFNLDWSVSTNQPHSCSFEGLGVDIWVEDMSGETLRIRERLKVKLGHVAVGISAQISMRTFSLATLDGKLVSPDTEVLESGMWLQCVPAPDSTTWDWRVRDGKLEKQDQDNGASDTCSTLAA